MSDSVPRAAPPELERASPRQALRSLVPTLVISGVFPVVLYQLLTGRGVPTVPALVAGSVFPLGYNLWGWARTRRLDVIAAASLCFIVVSAVASLASGSPRFTLIKESFFTGIFGLIFIGSLLAARPLMFYIVRPFATGDDPERTGWWNDLWRYPRFRRSMRMMTAIWGLTFVADALIRTALVFILSTSTFLVVSQLLFYAMFATAFLLTFAYGRRVQRKATPAAEIPRT
jgi:intracellular septation protein A